MTRAQCPHCHHADWEPNRAPIGAWGCRSCGLHMCPKGATKELSGLMGVSPQMLGALAREQSMRGRLRCSGCQNQMVSFDLKGAALEACVACGITCFHQGQLERLLIGMEPLELSASNPTTETNTVTNVPNDEARRPSPVAGHRAAPQVDALTKASDGGELSQVDHVRIRQQTRMGEVLVNIEQKNDYSIDLGMAGIAHISETGGGVSGVLLRQLLGARRSMNFTFSDTRGAPAYLIRRKFYFFLPTVDITDASNGALVGRIKKRFTLFSRCYDLFDGRGRLFTRIRAGFFRVWKFPLVDDQNNEIGAISKQYSGLLKEAMTDSDNFSVKMAPRFTEHERATALAAAINIDFEYFEKTSGGRSPLGKFAGIFFAIVIFGFQFCSSGFSAVDQSSSGLAPQYSENMMANARACYASADDEESCSVCCGTSGALFRKDDRSCICQGVIAPCPDGNGDPRREGAISKCARCCDAHLGPGFANNETLTPRGDCLCEGGYNPVTMSD